MSEFTPTLWVSESGGRVRLGIDGLLYADGPTLQDAADELVVKVLTVALAIRFDGLGYYGRGLGRPDIELVKFIWELADFAADGGDIRERLFGPSSLAA